MSKRDGAIIFGNCQAHALGRLLTTCAPFSQRFRVVDVPGVHEIHPGQVEQLHAAVERCSLLIVQTIREDYHGFGVGTETLRSLAPTATVVQWPDACWNGYFPDQIYLRDANGRSVVNGPFDYHDRVVLHAFASGLTVDEAVLRLTDPDVPLTDGGWVDNATTSLRMREAGCDVAFSGFIASAFDRALLFFTINHPANVLLRYLAGQILELIGLPSSDVKATRHEPLGTTFYPIHANQSRVLRLRFSTPDAFTIRGATFSLHRAVSAFFRYYQAHPALVALNAGQSDGSPAPVTRR